MSALSSFDVRKALQADLFRIEMSCSFSGKSLQGLVQCSLIMHGRTEKVDMVQFDFDIGDNETSSASMPRLREMTFNLATGEASSGQVADTVCDFPRVPLNLTGATHLASPPRSLLKHDGHCSHQAFLLSRLEGDLI